MPNEAKNIVYYTLMRYRQKKVNDSRQSHDGKDTKSTKSNRNPNVLKYFFIFVCSAKFSIKTTNKRQHHNTWISGFFLPILHVRIGKLAKKKPFGAISISQTRILIIIPTGLINRFVKNQINFNDVGNISFDFSQCC